MMRYLIGAVLIAAVAGAYAFWGQQSETGHDSYVTETLGRGPVTSTVIATGVVNPVTTVQVGTYVSGPIIAIDVDFNSQVRKGQRVAKIDPAPFQVKVRSAEANLANARAKVVKSRADLDLKRLTFERNGELRTKDLIAQNDLDTAKSNYDQAVAQLALDAAAVKQAEASLEEARINLNYTDISSPVDGVVVSRNVDVGQTVAASFQTPTLFLIAQDLTHMQVDASVSESDIGTVRDGQSAVFGVDAFPGREFVGKVVQVRNAPVTVQNVVTYDVVIAVANPDLELKPHDGDGDDHHRTSRRCAARADARPVVQARPCRKAGRAHAAQGQHRGRLAPRRRRHAAARRGADRSARRAVRRDSGRRLVAGRQHRGCAAQGAGKERDGANLQPAEIPLRKTLHGFR
jgi:HlyD family secretion protein